METEAETERGTKTQGQRKVERERAIETHEKTI